MWSDPRAALSWRTDLPAWGWILVVLVAAAFAAWTYRRLTPSPVWMATLSTLRALLMVVLIALMLGPLLLVERDVIEEACVVLLVDRSASMQIEDAALPDASALPVSRDDSLRAWLKRQADVFGADALGNNRRLIWLGFDSGTYEIKPLEIGESVAWPPADGRATALRTALEDALQRSGGQHLLGIVLFSDGRSPQPINPSTLDRMTQRGAALYTVPIGGAVNPLDVAITRVEAPDKAFVNDEVPVTVWITTEPSDIEVKSEEIRIRVVDVQRPDKVLAEAFPEADGALARLQVRWPDVGSATWRIEVDYQSEQATLHEAVTSNNHRTVHIDFIDRPVRVLYVESLPRWEYRYLKNLLVREKSIDSSVLLLSSDLSFAQEGDRSILRLPSNRREMEPYDVILVGDVDPATFGNDQWQLIRDQVSVFGAGLMWIAGGRHNPSAYGGSPLEAMFPLREASRVRPLVTDDVGLHVKRAEAADALSILRLRDPQRPSGDAWPVTLPGLRWVQDPGPLKPTAEVLARAAGKTSDVPLLVSMRYGAGQVLFLGTDETWRWRYGRGEIFFEQFWTQLIQMLGRGRAAYENAPVRLWTSHRMPRVGAPVLVSVLYREPGAAEQTVNVTVRRIDDDQTIALLLTEVSTHQLSAEKMESTLYQTTWRASEPGRYVIELSGPSVSGEAVTWGPIEVQPEDTEWGEVRPDHENLERAAAATGGRSVALSNLAALNRSIPQTPSSPDDLREPLWDSPLAFMVVILLPTLEWVGRKWLKLA